ncbi:terminase family protein [Klebsiella pneumoniae]|nr:terminase family protein [Klebsiella pneumoniae]
MIAFARLVDVDLSGDPIVIGNNGAELIFLGTNSNTAQSHNGDLYVDEIFWIPNFQKLRKVASGMASQSHLRTTYFSTPSTLAHGAYPFWSGELFNRGRSTATNVSTSISVTRRLPVAYFARTASGGRLSPLKTRSPVAAPCLTSTSSTGKQRG